MMYEKCPRCGDEFQPAENDHIISEKCGLTINHNGSGRGSIYIENHLIDFLLGAGATVIWINWVVDQNFQRIIIEELKWDIDIDYIKKLILLR